MVDSLIGVPGIERTTEAFRQKLVESAGRLGMQPDHLATIISFESAGTFDPAIRNPTSGCVGLIQFCRKAAEMAAKSAGQSLSGEQALAWLGAMSGEQQLDYVVQYFLDVGRGRKGLTLEQAYLLVFAPAYAFSDPSSTAYASGTSAYAQNRPMDVDGDGRITVADISRKITTRYNEGMGRPRVPVGSGSMMAASAAGASGAGLGMIAFLGIGALVGWFVFGDRAEELL